MSRYVSVGRVLTRRLVAVCLAGVFVLLGVAAPVQAAPLTAVNWAIDRGLVDDTGVRYTWTFTTATTQTISSVSFTVPSGTSDSGLALGDVFGLGAGTASRSGTTVTYAVTSPVSIPANTPILIAISGFTNTSTAGTYTSSVTAGSDGPTTSSSVSVAPNTDTVAIDVLPGLSFSSNKALVNFNFGSGSTASDSSTFHVRSNAANGYSLFASATPLSSGGGATIPMISTTPATGATAGAFPASGAWGFSVSSVTSGGAGALNPAGVLATQYANASSSSLIVSQAGTTNDDVVNMAYYGRISASQAAGQYTSKITYTAIPSY